MSLLWYVVPESWDCCGRGDGSTRFHEVPERNTVVQKQHRPVWSLNSCLGPSQLAVSVESYLIWTTVSRQWRSTATFTFLSAGFQPVHSCSPGLKSRCQKQLCISAVRPVARSISPNPSATYCIIGTSPSLCLLHGSCKVALCCVTGLTDRNTH